LLILKELLGSSVKAALMEKREEVEEKAGMELRLQRQKEKLNHSVISFAI